MMQKRKRWVVAGAVVVAMALFLAVTATRDALGFPLDDAWIHQTYARNLVRTGRWEFVPGVPSAGSTAPLWTLLLALGYLLRLPHLAWTYLLGGLSLLWLAWAGMALWRLLWPQWSARDWPVGLALTFTWPLVWAAASGMETLLFAAIALQLLVNYVKQWREKRPFTSLKRLAGLGLLSGLLVLTRPDGVVLIFLALAAMALAAITLRQKAKAIGVYASVVALVVVPYFAFNLWLSGAIWPNTFYAKQTEYAIVLAQPLWRRLARLFYFSIGGPPAGWRGMSGAHLLLLPGLVLAGGLALWRDWRQRRLHHLLPLLWAGGHVMLYVWRLPVTYQHGRYLMPAVVIWVLYGLAGWMGLFRSPGYRLLVILRRVASISFAALLLIFLALGSQAYADDVAFINNEMVAVARWLSANTPPDVLVASHDIGAIGYFGQRPLLDLAGLITPEVIPLLDDDTAVSRYVLASDADYLVTAPGWPYHAATASSQTELVFTTDYAWTRVNGLNNMMVFQFRR